MRKEAQRNRSLHTVRRRQRQRRRSSGRRPAAARDALVDEKRAKEESGQGEQCGEAPERED